LLPNPLLLLHRKRKSSCKTNTQSVFGSVVAVVFQNIFHSKMYQNNIFFIFKKLFLISAHQNDLKISKKNINLKKNIYFLKCF